jgi:hypothetical protein
VRSGSAQPGADRHARSVNDADPLRAR